jgi:hypothetical protein
MSRSLSFLLDAYRVREVARLGHDLMHRMGEMSFSFTFTDAIKLIREWGSKDR